MFSGSGAASAPLLLCISICSCQKQRYYLLALAFYDNGTKSEANAFPQGLTLEQIDKMMEETTPRTSARWKPTTTFAVDQQTRLEKEHKEDSLHVEDAA